jgi:hypothetical protein
VELSSTRSIIFEIAITEKALFSNLLFGLTIAQGFFSVFLSDCFGLVIYQGFSLVFLLDRFLAGLLEVLFIAISFSCCFEIAEEGFLRACLPVVGGVELLFLASFSSCCFEMAEGFSRDFFPAVHGVEILFLTSFFPC